MTTNNPTYKKYWSTWLLLLVVSIAMTALGSANLPRAWMVPPILLGMSVMAWQIAALFMHLKDEKRLLTVSVVGSTLFCGIALFVLIAWDALHVLQLTPR
jgi:hypothetical protein